MSSYVLGGGCFWCLDAVFRQLRGVTKVESGYAGGHTSSPTYMQVSAGTTGHAEVVRVSFDQSVIPEDVILGAYFLSHDPTTINRQGNDIGPQYRSIMLYKNDAERRLFEAAKTKAAAQHDDPIVTEIMPLETFYPAEPEHDDYYANNPEAGYCQVVITPKVAKARRELATWLK